MKNLEINEQILDSTMRLVGENGEQLGVVSRNEALRLANEANLDLVKISATTNPVVCKIMDYGKYKFEQQKREKDAKKKQKVAEIKIIQLSLTIGENDVNYRVKRAIEFLNDGDKVKVSLMLKGRQQAFGPKAIEVVDGFIAKIGDIASIDKPTKLEGRFVTAIIAPLKK